MRQLVNGAVLAVLVTALGPSAARAGVVDDLARNAWYWQARAREDRAVTAWEKVLAADPSHREALGSLAGREARLGHVERAREYLDRLRTAGGSRRELATVERAIALGSRFERLLDDARARLHAGQTAEGVAKYRELFGDGDPPGHLALEFYETVGGTPDGWEEARDGLQALSRRVPGEPKIQLALAKHLTYRPASRHDGIEKLEALAKNPAVSEEATTAWRQALLWLSTTPSDVALMRRYLEAHPKDAQLEQRVQQYAQRAAQEVRSSSIRSGFEALGRGDVRSSEALFKAVEGSSNDPRSLTGLGLVALKNGDYDRAQALLQRAKALAPGQADVWGQPLRSATFWSLLAQARGAREQRRDGEAETKLLAAVNASPGERHHADLALADLYLSQRQDAKAQPRLDELVAHPPADVGSQVTLVHLLVRAGRTDDALKVNAALDQADHARALSPSWIASEQRRRSAQALREAGDLDRARADLLVAMREDPQNEWVQHDLVNVYLASGDVATAQDLSERLVAARPNFREARVAQARVLAAQGDPSQALAKLGTVQIDRAADPELVAFRQELETQIEADRIIAGAVRGRREDARHDLLRLQRRIEGEPKLESMLAMAWASLGEYDRAVPLARGSIERSTKPSAVLRVRYAVVLLRSGEDRDLPPLLRELNNDPSLTRAERQGVDELRVAYAVRNADRARTEGQLVPALSQLTPLLGEFPDNPRLLCALGRLFWSGEQYQDSYATFVKVLTRDPGDFEARQGAIEAAQSMGDIREARRLALDGLEQSPNEPRAYLVAGRMEEREGNDGAAYRLYSRALAVTQGEAQVPAWTSLRVADANPELTPTSSTAALLREASRRFALGPVSRESEKALGVQSEVRAQMESIQARHLPAVGASVDVRRRDGQDGLGALTELRNVVEGSVPIAYRGRLFFQATPTELDGGALALGTPTVAQAFGAGVTLPGVAGVQQTAAGVELQLGYRERSFQAEVGTTPLGFPLRNVQGGARLQHVLGSFSFTAEVGRRSVTESMLSYAGVRDAVTGRTWGGVMRDFGRLDLAVLGPSSTYYVLGSFARLTGQGVASNYAATLGVGAELKPLQWRDGAFVTGVAASGMHFDRNLNHFTYGQGGYFSPQRFFHAGVPLKVQGEGRLKWHVAFEPGLNWFKEEASPLFPVDPGVQQVVQSAVGFDGASLQAYYPAKTTTGFALEASSALAYRLADRLDARLAIDYHRAPDYQELRAGLVLTLSLGGSSERGL